MGLFKPNIDKLKIRKDLDGLVNALGNRDAGIRTKAAEAITEIGGIKGIDIVGKTLEDPDPLVRRAGVTCLISSLNSDNIDIWQKTQDFLFKLRDPNLVNPFIDALTDDQYDFRADAARALGMIKGEKVIDPLIQSLDDRQSAVRSSAAKALSGKRDDKITPRLLTCLKDEVPEVRVSAIYSLNPAHGDKILMPLIHALKDGDSRVRAEAVKKLGLWEREEIVPPLVELLKDKDKSVRLEAAMVLLPRIRKDVDMIARPEIEEASRSILKSFKIQADRRFDALDILQSNPTTENLMAIVDALFETEYYPRCRDFNEVLIARLHSIGEPCVPRLVDALRQKDNPNDIRVRAVKVLGGMDLPEARKAVQLAAEDNNLNVKNVALSALQRIR